jgi:hypothetical protein
MAAKILDNSKKRAACFAVALLIIIAVGNPASLLADTISIAIASNGSDPYQTNNSATLPLLNGNTDTISIDKNPAWANPLPGSEWVSFGNTGDHSTPGYFDVSTGTVVSFYHEFYMPGEATSGFLNIMADDSTAVYLNGNLILTEAPIENNSYATCSDFATGCLESTTSSVNLMPYLVTGWNRLQFDVAQRAGSSFGLNYSGIVVDPFELAAVPEPSTLILLGGGLLGFGAWRRRK